MAKKPRKWIVPSGIDPYDIRIKQFLNDSFSSESAEKKLIESMGSASYKKGKGCKDTEDYNLAGEVEPPADIFEDMNLLENKDESTEFSFDKIAKRVVKKYRIICYWQELYYYDKTNYKRLNDKLALALIRKEMSNGQKADNWVFQNQERILNAIKQKDSIDINLKNETTAEYIVTLENGNLDLLSDKFFEHDMSIITTHKINAKYIKKSKHTSTPVWDSYIKKAIKGNPEESIRFVNAVLGYILCPSNDAKAFFVLGTAPNSGKTVFENFLHKLIGDENISNVALHDFGSPFRCSRIVGKVLNISMDLPSKKISEESANMIKMITGGDYIEMERKYQMPFNYKGRTKLVFATNHPIRTAAPDPAFYERMVLIPFMNTVAEEDRDPQLLNKLLAEKDAIVSKALKAASALYKNNFMFPVIPTAEKIKNAWATSEYESVIKFMKECCIETENEDDFISSLHLIKEYKAYCGKKCYFPGDMKLLVSIMKEFFEYGVRDLHSEDNKRRQARGFIGVKVTVK